MTSRIASPFRGLAARLFAGTLAGVSLGTLPASAEPATVAPAGPAECAADFHARLAGIKAGPFAALKTAGAAGSVADASLPGTLLFASPTRPRGSVEAAALRTADGLARQRGRLAGPQDANGRWIVSRVREDLNDFLSQGPTPFLCAGTEAYLANLTLYTDRVSLSPGDLAERLEAQRVSAAASLHAAAQALRPAPLPRFAPDKRPDSDLLAERLRSSVGLHDPAEMIGPPMLVANRQNGTRISEGGYDPDLPPLDAADRNRLRSEDDLLAAIDALMKDAETSGHLTPAASQTDSIVTGSVGETAPARRVLSKLGEWKPQLVGPASRIADPLVRGQVLTALADVEALDYLRVASSTSADPLGEAFHATFEAIRAAHRDACRCGD